MGNPRHFLVAVDAEGKHIWPNAAETSSKYCACALDRIRTVEIRAVLRNLPIDVAMRSLLSQKGYCCFAWCPSIPTPL